MRKIGYGLIFLLMFFVLFTGCATFKPVDLNPQIRSGQLVQKTNNFIVLFDKSASMGDLHVKRQFVDNPTRLTYGKDTTKNMIATIPEIRLNAGLRTFWADKTVLIYGMKSLVKEDYTKAINSIEFVTGDTPLEIAIKAAGNDLKGMDGHSALIIVSDFDMSPIEGDIKNKADISNRAVIDAISRVNSDYGDKLCVYAIQLGYTLAGKDLSERIVQNVKGGYNVNADKLATPTAMAAFVEKVISGNCFRYKEVVKEKVTIVALEDLHFDFDKSTLTPEAQTILKRNIQMLKDNPKAKVRIAGYTSAAGTEAYNQKLSERRAKAVQEYLINEGIIAPDRLSTIGYGETDPAMYEAAPKKLYSKAAKANMRVLFEIVVQ
ncbi:MAG: OmpA family protein [Smithellaceae bacterium]|jgi:outer membrane protein OmpA-like peptidoglycan-associated protein